MHPAPGPAPTWRHPRAPWSSTPPGPRQPRRSRLQRQRQRHQDNQGQTGSRTETQRWPRPSPLLPSWGTNLSRGACQGARRAGWALQSACSVVVAAAGQQGPAAQRRRGQRSLWPGRPPLVISSLMSTTIAVSLISSNLCAVFQMGLVPDSRLGLDLWWGSVDRWVCVLRAACCVLRAACCVLRAACCVLRASIAGSKHAPGVLPAARLPGHQQREVRWRAGSASTQARRRGPSRACAVATGPLLALCQQLGQCSQPDVRLEPHLIF
jgi:hypothetical protein